MPYIITKHYLSVKIVNNELIKSSNYVEKMKHFRLFFWTENESIECMNSEKSYPQKYLDNKHSFL